MRATRTTTSACAPTFTVGFGTATVTVATTLGSTVSVTGVEGSTTLIGGFWAALGSLLNGSCVVPRTSSVYVPGSTLALTVTGRLASVALAAMLPAALTRFCGLAVGI